jgi:LacI family transcriptional regulator
MKHIALDLGLSLATVSKVMRNKDDISDKTRKLVLERAKALNYKPNLAARALVTGRTYLIGLVVPDMFHTYFAQIANSLSRALLKKGYCLTVSISDENPDLEREILDHLLAWRPDALIIASATRQSEQIARIQKTGMPLILVDRCFLDLAANYVGVDNEIVGCMATEHLISVGCRRIAHLRGPGTSPGIGRLNGYLKTLAKYRIKSPIGYVSAMEMTDVPSRENGVMLMKRLLALRPTPDAVFCYNDPMAVGAVDAILAAGLRVPDDVAVIGSGNLYYGAELRVPLSSIDQQAASIGERIAQLALSLVKSKRPMKPKTFVIQPQLVVRASTQRGRRMWRES